MYVARSHADFNQSLNKVAGTNDVAYATPWPMSTRSGRAYMRDHYMQVGRLFATNALMGATHKSTLSSNAKFSPMQKATLNALATSSTEQEYQASLLAAVKHGALTNTAARVLSKPTAYNHVKKPALALGASVSVPAAPDTELNAVDDPDSGLNAVAPPDLELNAVAELTPDITSTVAAAMADTPCAVDTHMADVTDNKLPEQQLHKSDTNMLAPRTMNGGTANVQARKRKVRKT